MASPILGVVDPDPEIYQRIGKVSAEWGWIEMLLSEMLAHFCSAQPGAMYVITQNVSSASIIGWLRTLTHIQVKNADTLVVILDLLNEVDEVRADRNTIVHGTWRAADDPGFAWCQTFNWERKKVARSELWSLADLDAVISDLQRAQIMLANLGVKMGFLTLEPHRGDAGLSGPV